MVESTDRGGRAGRPPKHGRSFYEGALHAFLLARLPEFVNAKRGRIDCHALGEATGNARFTINKWMLEDRLSPDAVRNLVRVSGGQITEVELLPFLLA